MEIPVSVGGTPGKNCGGFCEFCYFKTADYKKLETNPINCRYCPPNQNGCKYCKEIIGLAKNGFKHPNEVLINLQRVLIKEKLLGRLNFKDIKINVGSWADIIFYPHLKELIFALKQWGFPVHLGYTSGKGINDEKMIENILTMGVDEVSFSVFSSNPEIRRKWMHDKTPEISLKAVEIFCENIEVNASTVVIPGVTDQEELFRTASTLEEWDVKSFTLARFANFQNQGNILNKRPIIDGIIPHSYEEFQDLCENFKMNLILGL